MKIKLTSVPVKDQDKALHFYTEILGLIYRWCRYRIETLSCSDNATAV